MSTLLHHRQLFFSPIFSSDQLIIWHLTQSLLFLFRLAMFGILGMLLQASASGKGVVQQLGETLTWPESRAVMEGMGTLGDYFPPGI